jgi:hypothetical protein
MLWYYCLVPDPLRNPCRPFFSDYDRSWARDDDWYVVWEFFLQFGEGGEIWRRPLAVYAARGKALSVLFFSVERSHDEKAALAGSRYRRWEFQKFHF